MSDPIARHVVEFRQRYAAIQDELSRVIVGQRDLLELVIVALLAGGHVLLEGVPGLGKTLLVRTLAQPEFVSQWAAHGIHRSHREAEDSSDLDVR